MGGQPKTGCLLGYFEKSGVFVVWGLSLRGYPSRNNNPELQERYLGALRSLFERKWVVCRGTKASLRRSRGVEVAALGGWVLFCLAALRGSGATERGPSGTVDSSKVLSGTSLNAEVGLPPSVDSSNF